MTKEYPVAPKISREQAIKLWNSLSADQKRQFNEMLDRMKQQELMLSYVGVDDNETIQHIVLEPKDKPSKPIEPFAKHFKQE
jgi:hypothetical protein